MGKVKRNRGLWLVGWIMALIRGVQALNPHSRCVFASSNPPLPHLSDGLAGGSLNWVPMATARLAARATLFPDAVWKWQGSQKATSEHRNLCEGFLSVWPSVCPLSESTSRTSAQLSQATSPISSCIYVLVGPKWSIFFMYSYEMFCLWFPSVSLSLFLLPSSSICNS